MLRYSRQKSEITSYTWKYPLLLTKGMEKIVMIVMMARSANPVGFAQPPTRPKTPGEALKNHSEAV